MTCTEGYCQPLTVSGNVFFLVCKLFKLRNIYMANMFRTCAVFIFQEFTNDIKNSSMAIKRMILLLFSDLKMMQIWSVNYMCQVCQLNMFSDMSHIMANI